MSPPATDRAPLVTVVIPAYNRAAYVVQAVESALQQENTAPGHEVIVIDDGSTDGTRTVLEPYRSRIHYVYQENRGLAAARNRGLELARGEFIAFVDADDYLLPGALAGQLACFAGRPELGVVQGGWRIVDQAGRTLREPEPWHRAPQLDLETWVRSSPLCVCAMLCRRAWVDRVGGFDANLPQQEDVDFVLRLALRGCEFAWLRRPTYCYRQHETNMSRNALEQVRHAELVFDRFFERPELPERIQHMKRDVLYYRYAWYAWRLHRNGFRDEVSGYLQRSLACSPVSPPQTVLQWLREFASWSHGVGATADDARDLIPYMRAAVPLDETQWDVMELLLPWWTAVWSPLMAGTPVLPDAARTEYRRLSTGEVLARARSSLMMTPADLMVATTNRFWHDVRTRPLTPPVRASDVVGLYLTAFGQAAMARRWQDARRALWRALRCSWHPRALAAWGRFIWAAIRYANAGSSGERVTW